MSKKSPRELETEVRQIRDDVGDPEGEAPEIAVEWREAAPDERPDGMEWDADGGRLAYDFWGAQWDALEAAERDGVDISAMLAGFGAGKSVTGARWILSQALEHPGSRFLALGVDFQKAKATTYPKLFAALPGERTDLLTSGFNGPEQSPIVSDFNRQDYRLTLTNDSVIILGSADQYARYAGAEFGAVYCDEAALYGDLHALTDMLVTRLRGVDGPRSMLWTLTGEGGLGAAWEILEERIDADGEPIGLEIDVTQASVLDNPYLPEADKERFKRKFEGTPKEEMALHGGWFAAAGLVYGGFNRDTHVIDHADAVDRVDESDEWRCFGYDAGWSDPRVLLEVGRTDYGQLIVLDEFYRSGSHVEDAITWLETNGKPQGIIYSEHHPGHIRKFGDAGWDAIKARKSLDEGIEEVRRRFDVDEEGRPGLLVAENCENLVQELLNYKREQVGTSAAEDHAADALRYLVMGDEYGDGGGGWSGSEAGLDGVV